MVRWVGWPGLSGLGVGEGGGIEPPSSASKM